MNTIKKEKDLVSITLKILREKEHLPKDLIYLMGETAALQLSSTQDFSIELPDLNLSNPDEFERTVKPILSPAALPLDRNHTKALFSKLIQTVTAQDPKGQETAGQKEKTQPYTEGENQFPAPMVEAAELIEIAFKSGELDLDRAVDECLQEPGSILAHFAAAAPEAPATLNFLVRAAIAPSLTAGVAALAEWVGKRQNPPEQKIRQTGTCPICGNLPHMLEIKGKEGFRFAHCSLCQHKYRIQRIACPVCDNTDMKKLKFFTVPEEPGFRVETCDACNTYIKTIDFREFDRRSLPALNDLESLTLDFIAQEQGYNRAALSVWGM